MITIVSAWLILIFTADLLSCFVLGNIKAINDVYQLKTLQNIQGNVINTLSINNKSDKNVSTNVWFQTVAYFEQLKNSIDGWKVCGQALLQGNARFICLFIFYIYVCTVIKDSAWSGNSYSDNRPFTFQVMMCDISWLLKAICWSDLVWQISKKVSNISY